MGKQLRWNGQPCAPALGNSFAQFHGVPVDDDRRQQVQPCDTVMLTFPGSIADFTKAIEAECAFQGMVRFALVEPDLSAALHVGIKHPVDHEQGAFDTANLAHGQSQLILAGIGGELL